MNTVTHYVVIYTVRGESYRSIPYTSEEIEPFKEAMAQLRDAKAIAIDTPGEKQRSKPVKRIFNPTNIEHMYIRRISE